MSVHEACAYKEVAYTFIIVAYTALLEAYAH